MTKPVEPTTLLQETLPYLRTLQEQYPEQPSIGSLIERIEQAISMEEEAQRLAAEWGKSFVTVVTDGTTEDWCRQMQELMATGLVSKYVVQRYFP